MRTTAVVFPFDQFGSAGTGAGAQLMGDALREMLEDIDEETEPTRGDCFVDQVSIEEFTFDTPAHCLDWRKTAAAVIREKFDGGESLLWLAGNHLCVLPVYEALDKNDLVIQFDAHLDVYNLSDSVSELSHGNFLMHTDGSLPRVVNIGSRDQFLPDKHTGEYFHRIRTAEDWHTDPASVLKSLQSLVKKAGRIWLDIDCDAFDPSYFPAVQHPLPFGLSPAHVLQILAAVWSPKIVGVSISEFDPGRDRDDRSLSTLVWLMEWLLLKRYESAG
ncbi:arginase family protein [Zavarzinella formosa]|uniref:arginase family protein n=1 Tax=Zavarzinella formosa TaxID=360055 RepID=UPI00030A8C35|nr:arginase family protein [Zavarzinella formosa]